MFEEKIKLLSVTIAGSDSGQLLRNSVYEFRYLNPTDAQPSVGLLMPASELTHQDGDLFPVMDQNIPEGDLLIRLKQMYPKQPLTAMHLLALSGSGGIGRLGYAIPGTEPVPRQNLITKKELLSTPYTHKVFDELVRAYLSTGAGVAGMQPKIMVPDRSTIPIPTVIVKAGSDAYPGLAANEFLCLKAAAAAGILTPNVELSNDGQLLLVDRFDIDQDGARLGFEDIASLMALRVRDTLSDRKYHGSYERVADVLKTLRLPEADLVRFFEQIAFSVMVSNGDGHLKNYGVLYQDEKNLKLAPMFDVVTTTIYRYARLQGGEDLEDRTMALKLFAGKGQKKTYPNTTDLLHFGRQVCGVQNPKEVIDRIAAAMTDTLSKAKRDERIQKDLLERMTTVWEDGMVHANTQIIQKSPKRHKP